MTGIAQHNKISALALIVALIALGLVLARPSGHEGAAKQETAFERVMRTRTLRCSYSVWAPYLMMDPTGKQMTGIDYDIMDAVGKATGIKIEWTEETGYASFPEQLRSGKDDVFCVSVWTSAARASRAILTKPIHFTPVYAFARDGDTRFDNNFDAINNEKTTVAVIDGSTLKSIADTVTPKAKQLSLPEISDGAQPLLALTTGKVDIVFADRFLIDDYNLHNTDNKIRKVEGIESLRTYGEAFAVGSDEWRLREFLNATFDELLVNGTIERILKKYETVLGVFRRVAPGYLTEDGK